MLVWFSFLFFSFRYSPCLWFDVRKPSSTISDFMSLQLQEQYQCYKHSTVETYEMTNLGPRTRGPRHHLDI